MVRRACSVMIMSPLHTSQSLKEEYCYRIKAILLNEEGTQADVV
jgi:hypothetical protein